MGGFTEGLDEWMTFVATTYNDVYFTTELQVIQWMQNPTGTVSLRDFEEWKGKGAVKGQPLCSLPNPCPLTTRELRGETQQLPLDPRSNWRWILLLSNLDASRVLCLENSTVIRVLNAAYF